MNISRSVAIPSVLALCLCGTVSAGPVLKMARPAVKLHRVNTDGKVKYKLTVATPRVKYGGTDANVTIRLQGDRGSVTKTFKGNKFIMRKCKTIRRRMRNGKTRVYRRMYAVAVNRFEQGSRDVLEFESKNLGNLTGLYVSHDNRGKNPGWYLGSITVEWTANGNAHRVVFPCARWLAKTADDRKISRFLVPEDKVFRFIVKVYTGGRKNAGTDARVRLDMEGSTGVDVASYQLDCPGDPFEAGSVDSFNVYSERDLGDIKLLRLTQDGTGKAPGWYVNKVVVHRINRPARHWTFRFDRWLDKESGQSALARPE